jgi:hypothetical protein
VKTPGFTAEASLGKLTKDYVLRSEDRRHDGSVRPQGLFVDRNGNIWYCDDVVGCTQVGHIFRPVLF